MIHFKDIKIEFPWFTIVTMTGKYEGDLIAGTCTCKGGAFKASGVNQVLCRHVRGARTFTGYPGRVLV